MEYGIGRPRPQRDYVSDGNRTLPAYENESELPTLNIDNAMQGTLIHQGGR